MTLLGHSLWFCTDIEFFLEVQKPYTLYEMSKFEKLLFKIMSGKSDNNLSILDLKTLLIQLGFEERGGAGSHRIYKKQGIFEMINIQETNDGKAKPYQVKQIRKIIIQLKLSK